MDQTSALLILFGIISIVYLIPTFIAFARGHRSRYLIFVLNLSLGATLIGWIIALIWAMSLVDAPKK